MTAMVWDMENGDAKGASWTWIKAGKVRDTGARCQCGATAPPWLKFEAGVFLPATRANRKVQHALGGVKMLAVLAAEGGFAPLDLKAGMVAVVVVEPHAQKYRRDDQAVDKSGDIEGVHGVGNWMVSTQSSPVNGLLQSESKNAPKKNFGAF
jgi:hypothetical protein